MRQHRIFKVNVKMRFKKKYYMTTQDNTGTALSMAATYLDSSNFLYRVIQRYIDVKLGVVFISLVFEVSGSSSLVASPGQVATSVYKQDKKKQS